MAASNSSCEKVLGAASGTSGADTSTTGSAVTSGVGAGTSAGLTSSDMSNSEESWWFAPVRLVYYLDSAGAT